jgi:arylsulfatase A-like enzyme
MNVLLISIDTLRADHLGCYGYPRMTSPHLDQMAAEGTVFEECFSTWIPTHPGHTTMLTGQDIFRHQIVAQGGKATLAPEVRTLAEILTAEGYYTAAADNLGRWFSRGFERYEGYRWAQDESGSWRKGEAVTETALRVLQSCADQPRPFFLFLHYWDPHTPYLPPPPFHRMFYGGDEKAPGNRSMDAALSFPPFMHYFRQWLDGVTDNEFPKAQYDASIAYADTCLARVFHRLEELKLAEETVVIVTADHGEEMDEHQMWFDHHGLYDTNLRVPLIMRMPGTVPAGARRGGFARLVDITPTVLDLTGKAAIADQEGMEGRSLAPRLFGREAGDSVTTLFTTECTWMRKRAVRTREWKLILAREPDIHGRPPVELYHLLTDPGEQQNVADARPEVVAALSGELFTWIARRMAETGNPDPIEEQEITLRQVGQPRPAAERSSTDG